MKRLIVGLVFAGLFHCGEAPPVLSVGEVRIDPLLRDDGSMIRMSVFGPDRSDGILLVCSALVRGEILPTDDRIDRLAQRSASLPDQTTLSFTSIDAGMNRVVFAQVEDINGGVIGNGCIDGVRVQVGETETINLSVFPL